MPLLRDGQDPDGLAARLAYHLHRLGITVKRLNEAGVTFDSARSFRAGSLQVSLLDVAEIARAIAYEAEDLSRPLEEDENAEWRFYRISARHSAEVWRRVAEASTAASIPQRRLSEILGLPQRTVSKLLSGKVATPPLHHDQADTFAGVVGAPQGAEYFIEGFSEWSESLPSR